jgi:hypothetical protein
VFCDPVASDRLAALRCIFAAAITAGGMGKDDDDDDALRRMVVASVYELSDWTAGSGRVCEHGFPRRIVNCVACVIA